MSGLELEHMVEACDCKHVTGAWPRAYGAPSRGVEKETHIFAFEEAVSKRQEYRLASKLTLQGLKGGIDNTSCSEFT
jgi:hypothetical protein